MASHTPSLLVMSYAALLYILTYVLLIFIQKVCADFGYMLATCSHIHLSRAATRFVSGSCSIIVLLVVSFDT